MEFKKMKAFMNFCFSCALIVSSVVIGSAQTTSPAAPVASPSDNALAIAASKDERYRIGFQDRLEIQVFRHPELTQRVDVNQNGTINLFRLNQPILAVCKTERELANDVAAAYRKDYLRNPEVNVTAVEQRSRAFAVMGAVEKPAQYMVNRRVRLLELIALAGGPSKEAGTRVAVARMGSTSSCQMGEDPAAQSDDIPVLNFRLNDVLQAKENLTMRPGDVVIMMKADVIYVYGNVNKQGQIQIKEPLTLTQALASAEGLKSASDKGKIKVLRQKPGSMEREEFTYNLDDITKRKVPDPFLEPNDVIAVNTDKTKEIFQTIGKSLTNGIPSLFLRVPAP
jgi:polysaccharide biosynthesis/export protein